MNLREWINNNAMLTSVIAGAVLLVVLGVLFLRMGGAGVDVPSTVYFIDLDTDEVFEQPRGTVPPVTAPSGGQGVRAHLFSCGECTPDQWFGYMETFSEEARRAHEEGSDYPDNVEEHHLVRDMDNGQWVPYFSAEGDRIREQDQLSCPEDPARSPAPCRP